MGPIKGITIISQPSFLSVQHCLILFLLFLSQSQALTSRTPCNEGLRNNIGRKEGRERAWRDGSVVKSSDCSCRGPGSHFQHSLIAILQLERIGCSLLTSMGTTCTCAYIHTCKTHIHIKLYIYNWIFQEDSNHF